MVKDVMIGRGILYDPLLPLRIKGDTLSKDGVKNFILSLIDAIKTMQIPENAKWRKIKEYWCLLGKGLPITEMKMKEVLRAATMEETENLIKKIIV